MAFKWMLNINCFFTQYCLTFVSVLLLTYLSDSVSYSIILLGQLLVLLALSWYISKKIIKYHNKALLSSYKRAVLITGCDSGFGNALAFKLNEKGYRVYATVLDPESYGAKKLMTDCCFEGKTHVFRMDVTKDDQIESVYEIVKNDLEGKGEELWAVVNNAGIITFGPFDWGTIDTYKQIFDVNTFGMVRVTRTFLPLLRQSKGRIVNLVSIAGRLTTSILPIYSMSKHASISFSDAIRRELSKYSIRVSTVEPVVYNTNMASKDTIELQIYRILSVTSEDVKQVYGEEYLREFNQLYDKFPFFMKPRNDIYEVIDLLVDAVSSSDPQIRYVAIAGNLFVKVMSKLFLSLPNELSDLLINLYENKLGIEPEFLKIKNSFKQ